MSSNLRMTMKWWQCLTNKEMGMEIIELVHPGMTREDSFPITPENSAIHLGSGSSRVLATPWMIAFMERVSHRLLTCCLPEG